MLKPKWIQTGWICLLFVIISCHQNKHAVTPKDRNTIFLGQIIALDIFKQEEKNVDAFNKNDGEKIKLSVDIMDSSIFQEDKDKNIMVGFIQEQFAQNHRTLYTIKFDKDQQKIISVNKEKNIMDDNYFFHRINDIPLPPIQK